MIVTIQEAKIILLCDNIIDLIYAETQGAISQELLEDDEIDLKILKEQAIQIILEKLEKQENIINDLKNKLLFYENLNETTDIKTIEEKINNWKDEDYNKLTKTIIGFHMFWEGLTGYEIKNPKEIFNNSVEGECDNEISIDKTNKI